MYTCRGEKLLKIIGIGKKIKLSYFEEKLISSSQDKNE